MRPEGVTRSQWFKYNMYFIAEHFLGLKLSEKTIRKKMNKLFSEAAQNPGMQGRGEIIDVKSIEYSDFEQFKNNRRGPSNHIAVFRGAANNWPCTSKWSKEFFLQHFAQTQIALIDNPGLVDKNFDNVYTKISIAEYLEEVKKDKNKYLRFSRIIDNNPILKNDLDYGWLRQFKSPLSFAEQTFMFMGEEGTVTPMHAGFAQTIFIQITGTKKWTICAPNERFFLNPVADRVLYYYTHADPKKPNDPGFPMMPYLKKYEIILNQGDVLWMPSHFWHHIENLTSNIGVAYKYTDIPQSFQLSKLMTTLFFLATKPTIFESFVYNKSHKQDYVFDKRTKKDMAMKRATAKVG